MLGVIVAVDADSVFSILQPTMGLEDVRTYLVEARSERGVAPAPLPEGSAQGSGFRGVHLNANGNRQRSLSQLRRNTRCSDTMHWNPVLQETVVAEVPQSAVVGRSLAAVLASGLVGLLTILIAAIAVLGHCPNHQ